MPPGPDGSRRTAVKVARLSGPVKSQGRNREAGTCRDASASLPCAASGTTEQVENTTDPMRVGFYTECYRPIVNGVVASIDALRAGLCAHGVEVVTIAPHFPRFIDDDARDVVRVVVDEARKMRRDRDDLDTVRTQPGAQSVDTGDDAVHDRAVTLGVESHAHGIGGILHLLRCSTRGARQACARVAARPGLTIATLGFDGSGQSCYLDRSSPGPVGSWRHSTEPLNRCRFSLRARRPPLRRRVRTTTASDL